MYMTTITINLYKCLLCAGNIKVSQSQEASVLREETDISKQRYFHSDKFYYEIKTG